VTFSKTAFFLNETLRGIQLRALLVMTSQCIKQAWRTLSVREMLLRLRSDHFSNEPVDASLTHIKANKKATNCPTNPQ